MVDHEQMIAELEGGSESQAPAPDQTPAAPETGIDYFLGDKQNRLPETAEFSFKHNGQVARVPASKLLNNYRQTAHLETKLKDLNDKYGAYEKEVGPLDDWRKKRDDLSQYETLQKWSTQNPDAWNYIWDSYQKAQNGLLPTQEGQEGQVAPLHMEALNRTISELRNQVSELSSWKSEAEKEKQEAKLQSAMEQIETEAKAWGDKYAKFGISLDDVNEEGITLKGQILKFAADNGIGTFGAAAMMYLGDTLLENATAMGRQESVKSLKGDAAAGIVSRTTNPPRGQAAKVDISKMNTEDRRDQAIRELEAG